MPQLPIQVRPVRSWVARSPGILLLCLWVAGALACAASVRPAVHPQVSVTDASGRLDAAMKIAFERNARDAERRIAEYAGGSANNRIEVVLDPERRIPFTEDPDAHGLVVIRLPAGRLQPDDASGAGLALEHELTHAIAPGGDRGDRLLVEGFAVHVQDLLGPPAYPDFDMSPHETVRVLEARTGSTIPLAESEEARKRRESGDERQLAYAQEGSFVRWLIETRGLEAFLAFYRSDAGFESGLGTPLDVLERDWRRTLAAGDAGEGRQRENASGGSAE